MFSFLTILWAIKIESLSDLRGPWAFLEDLDEGPKKTCQRGTTADKTISNNNKRPDSATRIVPDTFLVYANPSEVSLFLPT